MKKFILTTTIIIGALLIIGALYLSRNPQFGRRISKDDKIAYTTSPQWDGKKFVNQIETVMDISLKTMPKLMKETFSGRADRAPQEQLSMLPFDQNSWNTDTSDFQFI